MIAQWAWGIFLAVILFAFGAFFGALGLAVHASPQPLLDTADKLSEAIGAVILLTGAFVALWPVYEGRQARAEEAESVMIGLRSEALARLRHIVTIYAKFRHRLRNDVASYHQMDIAAFLHEGKPALEFGRAFVARGWTNIDKAPSKAKPGIARLLHQVERILGGLEFNLSLIEPYRNVEPQSLASEIEGIAEAMDLDLYVIEGDLPSELKVDFASWCKEAEKYTDTVDLTFFADARGPLPDETRKPAVA
jgi:hypothetical protein